MGITFTCFFVLVCKEDLKDSSKLTYRPKVFVLEIWNMCNNRLLRQRVGTIIPKSKWCSQARTTKYELRYKRSFCLLIVHTQECNFFKATILFYPVIHNFSLKKYNFKRRVGEIIKQTFFLLFVETLFLLCKFHAFFQFPSDKRIESQKSVSQWCLIIKRKDAVIILHLLVQVFHNQNGIQKSVNYFCR